MKLRCSFHLQACGEIAVYCCLRVAFKYPRVEALYADTICLPRCVEAHSETSMFGYLVGEIVANFSNRSFQWCTSWVCKAASAARKVSLFENSGTDALKFINTIDENKIFVVECINKSSLCLKNTPNIKSANCF